MDTLTRNDHNIAFQLAEAQESWKKNIKRSKQVNANCWIKESAELLAIGARQCGKSYLLAYDSESLGEHQDQHSGQSSYNAVQREK